MIFTRMIMLMYSCAAEDTPHLQSTHTDRMAPPPPCITRLTSYIACLMSYGQSPYCTKILDFRGFDSSIISIILIQATTRTAWRRPRPASASVSSYAV